MKQSEKIIYELEIERLTKQVKDRDEKIDLLEKRINNLENKKTSTKDKYYDTNVIYTRD